MIPGSFNFIFFIEPNPSILPNVLVHGCEYKILVKYFWFFHWYPFILSSFLVIITLEKTKKLVTSEFLWEFKDKMGKKRIRGKIYDLLKRYLHFHIIFNWFFLHYVVSQHPYSFFRSFLAKHPYPKIWGVKGIRHLDTYPHPTLIPEPLQHKVEQNQPQYRLNPIRCHINQNQIKFTKPKDQISPELMNYFIVHKYFLII